MLIKPKSLFLCLLIAFCTSTKSYPIFEDTEQLLIFESMLPTLQSLSLEQYLIFIIYTHKIPVLNLQKDQVANTPVREKIVEEMATFIIPMLIAQGANNGENNRSPHKNNILVTTLIIVLEACFTINAKNETPLTLQSTDTSLMKFTKLLFSHLTHDEIKLLIQLIKKKYDKYYSILLITKIKALLAANSNRNRLRYAENKICAQQTSKQKRKSIKLNLGSAESTKYTCSTCNQSFSKQYALDRHINNIHLKEPPAHNCKQCGKGFRYKNRLTSHLMIHTGEKPYECKTCNTAFSDLSNYQRHCQSSNHLDKLEKERIYCE